MSLMNQSNDLDCTTLTHCRSCRSNSIEIILDLGRQPLANELPEPEKLKDLMEFPLRLGMCAECSTIQLLDQVNPAAMFSDYVWVTGTSSTAKSYAEEFSDWVYDTVTALHSDTRVDPNHLSIVEIASNDGTFLQPFRRANSQILGIDPAVNIAKIAGENGIPTVCEFFGVDSARRIKPKILNEFTVVFARNVLPHVADPSDVLEGMKMLAGESGLGIVEFHDAGLMLQHLHYDYIYHEHACYFTLLSFFGLLERHGGRPLRVERSPISGGSWVVFFTFDKKVNVNQFSVEKWITDTERNLVSRNYWAHFAESVKCHAANLRELLAQFKGPIVGYGASARSSTLLNYCELDSEMISMIIDNNPLKHGRLTAGTRIPIVNFLTGKHFLESDATAVVLFLAWNFKDELLVSLRECGIKNTVICPLPGQPEIIKL